MKSSTVKLRKSQRKANYTQLNENSLDSLASNFPTNIYLFKFNIETLKKEVKYVQN